MKKSERGERPILQYFATTFMDSSPFVKRLPIVHKSAGFIVSQNSGPANAIRNEANRRTKQRPIRNIVLQVFAIFNLIAIFGGGRGVVAGGRALREVFRGILPPIVAQNYLSRSCEGHSLTAKTTRKIVPGSGFMFFGFGNAFASAAPISLSSSKSSPSYKPSSSTSSSDSADIGMDSCKSSDGDPNMADACSPFPTKVRHPNDNKFWLYHVENTTSTMDEAKRIVENNFMQDGVSNDVPKSFLISATSQSRGRGTTQRNWKSSRRGNALFTIGIQQSSWMTGLKTFNNGKMVPLTLLPLKTGSLVASQIQKILNEYAVNSKSEHGEEQVTMPKVTVKWPNDVLLYHTEKSSSPESSHEKIAGILIESSKDWFLIGIGINVGYAPDIPREGKDYGRKATCLSRYVKSIEDTNMEEHWIEVSKSLARNIAHELHLWLHQSPVSLSHSPNAKLGEMILDEWKSYVDWNMELILRDTPQREHVLLKEVLEDGRVVVREKKTGLTRTLVADYFL